MGLRHPDQSSTSDLDNSGEHVRHDKHSNDTPPLQAQRRNPLSQQSDQASKRRIDPRREKHRRNDDEEVGYHEINHGVRIANGRRRGAQPEDVADKLEDDGGEEEGGEDVEPGGGQAVDVQQEEEEVESERQGGEGEVGRVAVDDDRCVVGAVGVRDRGVDVAGYGRFAGDAVLHFPRTPVRVARREKIVLM